MLKPLAEQSIVITGASSGIGLATAVSAVEAGAKVLLVARDGEALRNIIQDLRSERGDAAYCVADVAHKIELEVAANMAMDIFGLIDICVNDAFCGRQSETRSVCREHGSESHRFGQVFA